MILEYSKAGKKTSKGSLKPDSPKKFSKYKMKVAGIAGAALLLSACVFDAQGVKRLMTNSNSDASTPDAAVVDAGNHNSNDGSIDVNDPRDAELDAQNQHDAALDANLPDSSIEDAEVPDAEVADAEIADAEVDGGLVCIASQDEEMVSIPLYGFDTVGDLDFIYKELLSFFPTRAKFDVRCNSNSVILRQDVVIEEFDWYSEDIPEAGHHVGLNFHGLNMNDEFSATIIVSPITP